MSELSGQMRPRGAVIGEGPLAARFSKAISRWMPRSVALSIEDIGGVVLLGGQVLGKMLRPPYRIGSLFAQMEFIGVGSLFIVLLTGLFSGMVFAVQTEHAFGMFKAKSLVGSTVTLTLTRSLGPVLSALMVTARAGSAMTTELGTMKVTEQIDAMRTMAVSPTQYLAVPRVLATTLMLPVLTILFDVVGTVGAYLVAVKIRGLSAGLFLNRLQAQVQPSDITVGLWKAGVFGFAIGLIACYKGFTAQGGAKGVGVATTEAVVMCSVSVLILEYFLSVLTVY